MTDAALSRPASADRTALDRFLAVIPFAGAAMFILMILFWEASVRKTPTIFLDELKWTQLSRAIATTGHAARRGDPTGFQSLYSFLIAPWWWLHSTSAAYTAIKYVNVAVMSTAAIPVYFLCAAPRLAPRRGGGGARRPLHFGVLLRDLPPSGSARVPGVFPLRVRLRARARRRRPTLDDRRERRLRGRCPGTGRASSAQALRLCSQRSSCGWRGRAARSCAPTGAASTASAPGCSLLAR